MLVVPCRDQLADMQRLIRHKAWFMATIGQMESAAALKLVSTRRTRTTFSTRKRSRRACMTVTIRR